MEKITEMNKPAARKIGEVTEAVLKRAAEGLGLEVTVGGGKYDPHAGTFAPKVEFSLPGAQQREFAMCAPLFGISPEAYHVEFDYANDRYRLEEIHPRKHRYPFIATRLSDASKRKLPETAMDAINAAT